MSMMRRKPGFLRAVCLALLAMGAAATAVPTACAAERGPLRQPQPAQAGDAAPLARVMVKFKAKATILGVQASSSAADALPQRAGVLGSRLGLTLADGRSLGARSQLLFARGINSAELAERLAADADVEWAVPDRRQRALRVPNDSLFADGQTTVTPAVGQWYLRAPDATAVSAINAVGAWNVSTGRSTVVVAVIDTGVRRDHPDLAGKLLPGYDFVDADAGGTFGTANDGNGRDSDPSDPGDWITSSEDASGEFQGCGASDSSWHGTQTAGLIGARTNNALGMAGVGWSVRVLPVRALGKCGGYDSDIQDAMRWSAGLTVVGVPANPYPAKVINMSLGSQNSCTVGYREAVSELAAIGVVVVAAAGNEGEAVNVPGNCPGAIAVAGLRHTGTKVGYSSLGAQVAISAPAGNCVNESGTCLYPLLTTSNTGATAPLASAYTDGGGSASLGTSFSAPLVSGTVALMLSVNAQTTPAQILSKLQSSARAFPTSGADPDVVACRAPSAVAQLECYCTRSTCGAGMLDAAAAVAAISAAPAVTATIGTPSPTPVVGTPFTVDGSGSSAGTGRTIAAYAWAITSGASVARISGASNAATVTIQPSTSGSFTLQLTVTDDLGNRASSTRVIAVKAAPAASTGGSGGGAMEPAWALGLLAAIAVLRRRRR